MKQVKELQGNKASNATGLMTVTQSKGNSSAPLFRVTFSLLPSVKANVTDTAFLIQVADLKTRNQQLDSENTELSQRNSKNQADVQDLNQQLARVLKQKERDAGKCTLEEWEKERLVLKEELENSKVKVEDYAISNNMK